MTAPTRYIYDPLQADGEFRLVNLLPGTGLAQISVEIFHTTLESSPRHGYEALSYAWGAQDYAHTALVGSAEVAISTNLHEALQHLRSPGRTRTLWIDALSIDQKKDKERSQQIGLMRDIYRTAKRVVIWLGAKSASSDLAFQLLQYMSERERSHFPKIRKLPGDMQSHASSIVDVAGGWKALNELFARPWWSRAWVLQEAWSATNAILQCGDSILTWDIVQRAASHLAWWDDWNHWPQDGGALSRQDWASYDRPGSLDLDPLLCGILYPPYGAVEFPLTGPWEGRRRQFGLALHLITGGSQEYKYTASSLLWNTWDREAADPRDKIYSIIGVAGTGFGGAVVPDYEKSLAHVFREAAHGIIVTEKNLDLLLAASGVSGPDNLLPSWVPDWRKEVNDRRPNLLVNGSRVFTFYHLASMDRTGTYDWATSRRLRSEFSASKESEAFFEFDDALENLTVMAVVFDEITDMTESLLRKTGPSDSLLSVSPETWMMEQFREDLDSAYNLAARSGGAPTDHPTGSIESGLRRQVNEVLTVGCSSISPYTSVSPREVEHIYPVASNIMRRRRFLVTRDGRFAVGADVVQRGDVLCVIAGCNYPMILRKVAGKSTYKIVADAYVHGAMRGEVLDTVDTAHMDSSRDPAKASHNEAPPVINISTVQSAAVTPLSWQKIIIE